MPSAGGLNLELSQINPDPVPPGGRVTVDIAVRETIELVGPLDPALCNPTGIAQTTGLQATVTADPEWATGNSRLICVPVYSFSSGRRNPQFSFVAPDVSTVRSFDITVTLEQTGKNKRAEVTRSVTVDPDSTRQPCSSGDDCPDGYTCEAGECVPDDARNGDGGLFDRIENLGQLAVIGLGAYAVAQVAGAAEELGQPDSGASDAPETSSDSDGEDEP